MNNNLNTARASNIKADSPEVKQVVDFAEGLIYTKFLCISRPNHVVLTKRREQTTLRTVRIPNELDNALETISKEKGLSVNSFVSMLLRKYVEWDKYADRFGYITLTRESLRRILHATDDSKLIESAQDYGSTVPKEFLMFWFKELNIDSVLNALSLRCKYANVAEYELKTDGRNYMIILHHDLGLKWSEFFGYTLQQEIKTILQVLARLEISRNSIVLRFQLP